MTTFVDYTTPVTATWLNGVDTVAYTTVPTLVSNNTGVNTGDETTATIKTKLGITTLSGSNTGDQDLSSYLTSATAASTYLTQTNASTTYLTQSNAASTYLGLHAKADTAGTADTASTAAALTNGGALNTPASGNLANCSFPTLNQDTTGTADKCNKIVGGIQYGVLYQSAVGVTGCTSAGTAGYVLTSNGTSAPSFAPSAAVASAPTITATSNFVLGSNNIAASGTPTIASGFGTSASIVRSNGSLAFYLYIGTGGTADSGTITLPVSATSWLVIVNEPITTSGYATNTRTFGSGSGNTITLVNEIISTHAAAAWESGRYLSVLCIPMS